MEISLVILSVAVVIAAAILAFARRGAPAATPDSRLDAVISGQGDIAGQFKAVIEQQGQLQRSMAERIEALDKRLGESLKLSAEKTGETLGGINARLSVIDEAQKNITALSGHVVSLREIFSDKQARGAFGQERMEAIVADQLSPDQYEFQATLSNGARPDCAIRIPNVTARIIVDSKFPLGAFEALRRAANDEERKAATAQLRTDMQKHVKDIADKYLIPGETQTPAILFVPSESIYAELHANFAELLQRARQAQVVVVSPHVFMLVVGTIQGLMRDAKMREQADLIRKEVGVMLNDVRLLGDRVAKLQSHFNQADADIKNILVSTGKIVSRGEKIETVDLVPAESVKKIT